MAGRINLEPLSGRPCPGGLREATGVGLGARVDVVSEGVLTFGRLVAADLTKPGLTGAPGLSALASYSPICWHSTVLATD